MYFLKCNWRQKTFGKGAIIFWLLSLAALCINSVKKKQPNEFSKGSWRCNCNLREEGVETNFKTFLLLSKRTFQMENNFEGHAYLPIHKSRFKNFLIIVIDRDFHLFMVQKVWFQFFQLSILLKVMKIPLYECMYSFRALRLYCVLMKNELTKRVLLVSGFKYFQLIFLKFDPFML